MSTASWPSVYLVLTPHRYSRVSGTQAARSTQMQLRPNSAAVAAAAEPAQPAPITRMSQS